MKYDNLDPYIDRAVRCPDCDLVHVPTLPEDAEWHVAIHRELDSARGRLNGPVPRLEVYRMQNEAVDLKRAGDLTGARRLKREGLWHERLLKAIIAERSAAFPTLDQFLADDPSPA